MKPYDWSAAKNAKLKNERLITFEDVLIAINEGKLLDTVEHPNKLRYVHQRMFVIEVDAYVYLVPYVEDDNKIFLKTIIPSRRATKKYLKGDKS